MERNPKKSSYLTVQELTQSQRREQIQSSITPRLNASHQIIVNRQVVQGGSQGHGGQSGGFQNTVGTANIDQNVVNKLMRVTDQNLKSNVKNMIREAYSDIDFNNFDIAYNKVSQAIKMLEDVR